MPLGASGADGEACSSRLTVGDNRIHRHKRQITQERHAAGDRVDSRVTNEYFICTHAAFDLCYNETHVILAQLASWNEAADGTHTGAVHYKLLGVRAHRSVQPWAAMVSKTS